jgi:hypothetical protein
MHTVPESPGQPAPEGGAEQLVMAHMPCTGRATNAVHVNVKSSLLCKGLVIQG